MVVFGRRLDRKALNNYYDYNFNGIVTKIIKK